ncbi:unnamed protein product [Urochloa humidicola]
MAGQAGANTRSCRHCHRELRVCRCGGARRCAQPRRDPDAGGDRISALHDDVLLQILTRVGCVHFAARTSVLSRRWRGLWTRLPELVLREMTPESLDAVLAHLVAVFDPQARAHPQALAAEPQPPLSLLDIRAPYDRGFSLAQIYSLFGAAVRLQPASLVVDVTASHSGMIWLPRLDHTKSIELAIWGISPVRPQNQEGDFPNLGIVTVRPCDVFFGAPEMPNLESLTLRQYNVFLGALLHHFSALRSLSIPNLNVGSIKIINLPLLQDLFLIASAKLQNVVIMAPRLKTLTFHAKGGVRDDFTLSYSAPEVEDLSWKCSNYASRYTRFGDMWILRIVNIKTSEPLGQLQQSPDSNTLSLDIMEWELFVQEGATPSFEHCISSISPVANFSCLELCINSRGHVYGAMVLHLLEVYTLIERLKVDLRKFKGRGLCSTNCHCIQLNDWRSQTISLTHLKEMEIKGVGGEDHEIDMLKLILRSAAMLETMAITFSIKTEKRIHLFSSKIHSILKAHPSVYCKIYRCSGEQVLLHD